MHPVTSRTAGHNGLPIADDDVFYHASLPAVGNEGERMSAGKYLVLKRPLPFTRA
jgi:hypothetical protein